MLISIGIVKCCSLEQKLSVVLSSGVSMDYTEELLKYWSDRDNQDFQKCLLYSRCLQPSFLHKVCAQHILIDCCSPLYALKFRYGENVSNYTGTGDVWFSLNGTTYQNNSIVMLEDIGGGGDALLCQTSYNACCRSPALGNWFFPNETRVPSIDWMWDFTRTRNRTAVHMNRRRGGVEGIYYCEIPDSINVTQTIYIGVYSSSSGEWSIM